MWSWQVIQPSEATNHILDPSFEALALSATGNPWSLGSGAVSSSTPYRGMGAVHYSGGTGLIASQTLTPPTDANAVASAWALLTQGSLTLAVKTAGGTVLGTQTIMASPYWQRVTAAVALGGNTSVVLSLSATGTTSVDIDAVQLERGTVVTSYFDGDEPGCVWRGRIYLSQSWRPLECRTGGIAVPLSTYLKPQAMQGWGRMTHTNVTTPFGLQGGAVPQRSVKQSRAASIVGNIVAGSGGMDDLHNAQASLGRLLGQDLVIPQQCVRLIYSDGVTGAPTLATDVMYEGGLDFSTLSGLSLLNIPLRFNAPDPSMVEDKENSAALSLPATGASLYYKTPKSKAFVAVTGTISGVLDGEWVTPPYGATSLTRLLWLCGGFITAGSRLAVFDPAAGTLTSAGIGPTAGTVNSICQCGRYLYVGGSFSGFSGYSNFCRYDLISGAVSQPVSPGSGAVITCMDYDPTRDILYVGGTGTRTSLTGASTATPSLVSPSWMAGWTGLPSGASGALPVDVAVDVEGNVYWVDTLNAPANTLMIDLGVPGATTLLVIGVATYTTTPQGHSIAQGPDGRVYYVGNFESITPGDVCNGIAVYTGAAWVPFFPRDENGSGTPQGTWGRSIAFDSAGRAHIAGLIHARDAVAPGSVLTTGIDTYVVAEHGAAHVELVGSTAPGSTAAAVPLVFVNPSDDSVLFVANDSAAPAATWAAQTSAVTYSGTAPAPIRLVAVAGSSGARFGGLRNERTGQAVYFPALALLPGEVLYLDTTPGATKVYTDQRGDISSQVSPGSDLGNLVLLDGSNKLTILATGLASASVTWRNRHAGIDGAGMNVVSVG